MIDFLKENALKKLKIWVVFEIIDTMLCVHYETSKQCLHCTIAGKIYEKFLIPYFTTLQKRKIMIFANISYYETAINAMKLIWLWLVNKRGIPSNAEICNNCMVPK